MEIAAYKAFAMGTKLNTPVFVIQYLDIFQFNNKEKINATRRSKKPGKRWPY